MSDNYIATKGDVKRSHQELANEVYAQTSAIDNKINQVYNGITQQLNYIQEETNNKVNELSARLNEQNKKFEDLQKTLENPLATQSNELRNRAIESLNNNWIEEAKEEILKALELNNKDYISHLILARIYKIENNFEKAIEHYDKAIKYASPYDRDFVNEVETEKAISYMEEGRKLLNISFDEATKYFDIATKKGLINYNPNILQQLNIEKSLIYYQYGFKEKALEILLDIENYIKENNLNVIPQIFYYETLFYLDKGDKEKALEKLKECFLADINQEKKLLEDKLLKEIITPFKEWLETLKDKEKKEIEKLKSELNKKVKYLDIRIGNEYLSKQDIEYIKNLETKTKDALNITPVLYVDFLNLKNYLNNLNNQILTLKENLKNHFENIAKKTKYIEIAKIIGNSIIIILILVFAFKEYTWGWHITSFVIGFFAIPIFGYIIYSPYIIAKKILKQIKNL